MANRIAILIGNQNFKDHQKLPPLGGPANDVQEMARILSDPSKGNFTVLTLVDETSYNIKVCLERVLSNAGPGDLILVHYSGHGKIDKLGALCLTAADTETSILQSTTIPARQLCYMISASACDTVVLLLDCCYSGIAVNVQRGDVESQLRTLQTEAGLFILSASSEIQTASEMDHPISGKKMGQFTYSVVEAIDSGAADVNADGLISISELVQYLKLNVKTQSPQWFAANARGDPHISFASAAYSVELFAMMESELRSDDIERRTTALSYFGEMQVKLPQRKLEIRRIIENYENMRRNDVAPQPDYDSANTHPAFVGWKSFSFGLPPTHSDVMRPAMVEGMHVYELRSFGTERIGVQRIFNFYQGRFKFRYRVISATGDNVQFHAVPMKYTGDLESYPWQTDRHLAYINNFHAVPDARLTFVASESGDAWQEGELRFDFTSMSRYVVVSFGPRINECSVQRGVGYIQIANIKLFGTAATPSRHAR